MNPRPLLHEPPPRRNTTFKSDVLRLVTGTGLAQIIAVLAAPILARLYALEAFGLAALNDPGAIFRRPNALRARC